MERKINSRSKCGFFELFVKMSHTRLGMIRCEHCGRQFNPHSGARHIPWCAKQQSENRKHKLTAEKRQALERYKWRISYRPTNQINQINSNKQHHQFEQNLQQKQQAIRLAELSKSRAKKSSFNSSTTLSSPSASSTNSTGTGSLVSGFSGNHGTRATNTTANKQVSSLTQLKRSISSLTLTKQAGVAAKDCSSSSQPVGAARSNWSQQSIGMKDAELQCSQTGKLRTKSVNDLSAQHMDVIVESLTKRMDEIYAQNQLLLANFLEKGKNLISTNQLEQAATKNLLATKQDSNGQDSDNIVMCHHCKANCFEQANYCHRCGCKVRIDTGASSLE